MPPRCAAHLPGTLTPFLYPSLLPSTCISTKTLRVRPCRHHSQTQPTPSDEEPPLFNRLNPPPDDYSRPIFADRATVTIGAGSGGHGCISFLREKYIDRGPANGGSGGTGGNVYIQAVRGETSLHKLARRGEILAGRGRNGQGKTRGGERGRDVVIQVPVGTVVREIARYDPVAIDEEKRMKELGRPGDDADADARDRRGPHKWDREKWLLYPATTPDDIATAEFPRLPRPRRSALAMAQAPAPISLDLAGHMDTPLLLAAGAVGGLGNPHFVTKEVPRPKYATRGEKGMSITLELELKLLADVGLVGLPNAGKSTLLRALTNSRARVGSWPFTTLHPNIGTVVLDADAGRPIVSSSASQRDAPAAPPRTRFTIADIPGLLPDAHRDRGLGISFLRHVERARLLAFVLDLHAGDAVAALRGLWHEVARYASSLPDPRTVRWSPLRRVADDRSETIVVLPEGAERCGVAAAVPAQAEPARIARKAWFVVATKADLPGTQANYEALRAYLEGVERGEVEHPAGTAEAWRRRLRVVPVSALHGEGVRGVVEWAVELLDEEV